MSEKYQVQLSEKKSTGGWQWRVLDEGSPVAAGDASTDDLAKMCGNAVVLALSGKLEDALVFHELTEKFKAGE